MWAGHVPHHSSESFNLTVALRQPWFQTLTTWFLFIPLAFIGFSTGFLILISALDILYQFWIHTPAIRKMPRWFEFIFNTPSHHRVHHGRQEKYLDKNHGGVLIIWDRLFGTFQEEQETPEYGITQPLQSWNPVWANIHHFVFIKKLIQSVKSFRQLIRVFFAPPGFWSYKIDHQFSSFFTSRSYTEPQPAIILYLVWSFSQVLGQLIFLMIFHADIPLISILVMVAFILWNLYTAGMLLDEHPQFFRVEILRFIFLIIVGLVVFINYPFLPPNILVWAKTYLVGYIVVSCILLGVTSRFPFGVGKVQ